jgi:hypothetical protein
MVAEADGVAARLLGRMIEGAREIGFHKIVLAALAWNAAGEALYTKLAEPDGPASG